MFWDLFKSKIFIVNESTPEKYTKSETEWMYQRHLSILNKWYTVRDQTWRKKLVVILKR